MSCGSFASHLVFAHTLVHLCVNASFPRTPAPCPTLLPSAKTQQDFCTQGTWPLGWRLRVRMAQRWHSAATQCQSRVSLGNGTKWGTSTELVPCSVYKRPLDQCRKSVYSRTGLSQGNQDRSTLKKHIQANAGMESRGEGKKVIGGKKQYLIKEATGKRRMKN